MPTKVTTGANRYSGAIASLSFRATDLNIGGPASTDPITAGAVLEGYVFWQGNAAAAGYPEISGSGQDTSDGTIAAGKWIVSAAEKHPTANLWGCAVRVYGAKATAAGTFGFINFGTDVTNPVFIINQWSGFPADADPLDGTVKTGNAVATSVSLPSMTVASGILSAGFCSLADQVPGGYSSGFTESGSDHYLATAYHAAGTVTPSATGYTSSSLLALGMQLSDSDTEGTLDLAITSWSITSNQRADLAGTYEATGAAPTIVALARNTTTGETIEFDVELTGTDTSGTFAGSIYLPPGGPWVADVGGNAGTGSDSLTSETSVTLVGPTGHGYMPTGFNATSITLGPNVSMAVGGPLSLQVIDSNGWRRAGATLKSLDTNKLTVPATSDAEGKFSPTALVAGVVTVTAEITDPVNGKLTASVQITITGLAPPPTDTQAPTVSLASSANGQTVTSTGPLAITASAADNVGVVGVQFYRDGVAYGAEVLRNPADPTTFKLPPITLTGPANNGTFSWTARARDAAGNSTLSEALSITIAIPTPATPPAAPSGLVVTAVTSSSVTLKFTDNSTDEESFMLQRAIGATGAFVDYSSLPALPGSGDTRTVVDEGLPGNTKLRYRVRAVGSPAGNDSGHTAEVVAVTSPNTSSGQLAELASSKKTVSGLAGQSVALIYTATDGNGSARPGVTVVPTIFDPLVAQITPPSAVTGTDGTAVFTVSLLQSGESEIAAVAFDTSNTLGDQAGEAPLVRVFAQPLLTSVLLRSILVAQRDSKFTEEIVPYAFDFKSLPMARGESVQAILSVTCAAIRGEEVDPDATEMLLGVPQMQNDVVVQYVGDGVAGEAYLLRCTVLSTIAAKYTQEIRVSVFAREGLRASGSNPVI